MQLSGLRKVQTTMQELLRTGLMPKKTELTKSVTTVIAWVTLRVTADLQRETIDIGIPGPDPRLDVVGLIRETETIDEDHLSGIAEIVVTATREIDGVAVGRQCVKQMRDDPEPPSVEMMIIIAGVSKTR